MKEKARGEKKSKTLLRIRRAISEILPLCIFSLFVAAFVCSVANDMYAFVKKENEVQLAIESPYSLEEFSKILGKYDVVENPTVFSLYVMSKDKIETVENFTGELVLNSNMSYREILSSFS